MEDSQTHEILNVLEELRRVRPTLRFGQLVATVAMQARGPVKSATWDVEDPQFLLAARDFLENLKRIDPEAFADRVPARQVEREKVAA